jgi:hypothetical protein
MPSRPDGLIYVDSYLHLIHISPDSLFSLLPPILKQSHSYIPSPRLAQGQFHQQRLSDLVEWRDFRLISSCLYTAGLMYADAPILVRSLE